jgi:hypothetical protein
MRGSGIMAYNFSKSLLDRGIKLTVSFFRPELQGQNIFIEIVLYEVSASWKSIIHNRTNADKKMQLHQLDLGLDSGTLKTKPTPKTFSIPKAGSSFRYLRILVMKTSRLLPIK